MKKILLLAMLVVVPTWADIIIDNITWSSPAGYGQPARAGVINAYSGGYDYLDGQAVCNPQYPFPPPFFFTLLNGGEEVTNDQPVCGNVTYYIIGQATSTRADGNYDRLLLDGTSWYPNKPGRPPNTPNIANWGMACSQQGTDIYGRPNGVWGEPFIISHTSGTCYA